jgi:hypothetical protein
MGRRRLLSSKEAATLLDTAVDEDNLIRHFRAEEAPKGHACPLRTVRRRGE